MAGVWYNSGLQKILNGTVDLDTDQIDALLVTSGYTFDDQHDFVSDITNELTGGNYSRVTVTGIAITVDDVNDGADITANDIIFPSLQAAAGTPVAVILFAEVGADSSDILLCKLGLPGTAPNGNNYVCQLSGGKIGHWRNTAGGGLVYNTAIVGILNGTLNLLSNTLNVGLYEAGYIANPDHDVAADLTNQLSGGNYGEVTATGKVVSLDDVNNGAFFDLIDPSFASLGAIAGNPTQAVIRRPSADQLVCRLPLTAPDTPDGNNYIITLAAAGAITVRNSAS